ncbi:hypothetical protein [Kitasatospora sp. HPMI-4]|uniref:hypothetical protein n=1 Tax=Kitasatospora sp. HPMI-4 TaxID=3448443 RepID=UPI003F1C4948
MTDNGNETDALAEYYETHELTEDEIMGAEPAEARPADTVMITTSLRLPKPVMDEVRRRAQVRGVRPTSIMREWIEAAIADQEATVPLSVITAAVAEYQHRKAS